MIAKKICLTLLAAFLLAFAAVAAKAQTTAFNYQGHLDDGGAPANGTYDFEFLLFDQASGGSQVGATVTANGVAVVDGAFSVVLDFGSQFPGDPRWLEIRVAASAPAGQNVGGLTILTPRQPVNSVPYALRSGSAGSADTAATANFATSADTANTATTATSASSATTADTATNALNLGGVAAGQYVVTTDPRLSDARAPTAGSGDYVQNGTAQQPSSDFNISGTGKAAIFDAGTQYNIAGARFLGATQGDLLPVTTNIIVGRGAGSTLTLGDANTFTGYQAGQFTTEGDFNTFVGFLAGHLNTTGGTNTFFGARSGTATTTSSANSFFGAFAGDFNTTGGNNSYFGTSSGANNTSGATNSFFGSYSGNANTTGDGNSFFGYQAGTANTEGVNNSFFGQTSGVTNTTGGSNVFVGFNSGFANTSGSNNTLLGSETDLGSDALSYAAAIGSGSTVETSNTIVLGRATSEDTVHIPGMLQIGTLGTAGTEFLCRNGLTVGGCSGVGNFVVTTDPRLSDARTPLPGSADYIQNGTSEQTSSNFNISGDGTAGGTLSGEVVNAVTQYNIGGDRILSNSGTENLFAGIGAGTVISDGYYNAFFGYNSGLSNTSGTRNSFFGHDAGFANTIGERNSFFGENSGHSNVSGNYNSFFGSDAGRRNTVGYNNSFFGASAGYYNTEGSNNSFFGTEAGQATTTGNKNSYFGQFAGSNSTTGTGNSFFGQAAGYGVVTGRWNTMIGNYADVGSESIENSTAIGYLSYVTQDNSIVLGSIMGVQGANADTNVGIGTTAPSERLHVVGNGLFTGDLTVNGTLNAALPVGSANYIQNGTTQQGSSNFNISGNGTAGGTLSGGKVNAADQYYIGGSRILGNPGTENLFTGIGAGDSNTTGIDNAFFGHSAGYTNDVGIENSFFGAEAGYANTDGVGNSFFGRSAGHFNSAGMNNAFFGIKAGERTTDGDNNTFVGAFAGSSNSTGGFNTFVGYNTGIGGTGNANTTLGAFARTSLGSLVNATAIGASSWVEQSNSMVLGSIEGVNSASSSTRVGIGITSPTNTLTVVGAGSDVGGVPGFNEIVARFRQTTSTTHLGVALDAYWGTDPVLYFSEGGTPKWDIRNDAGDDSFQIRYHSALGSRIIRFSIDTYGYITVPYIAGSGYNQLCTNGANQISYCSSSVRYKSNIESFRSGSEILKRLRPVTFNWKDSGALDLGLVAEEVADIDPLLVTFNAAGQVEGVKYDRIGVVLINVIKEQKDEIESLREEVKIEKEKGKKQYDELKAVRSELSALKALVCAANPGAAVCKAEVREQDGQDR